MQKLNQPTMKSGIICLVLITAFFTAIGYYMGAPNMLNTIMHTAHDLLLNTVFFLMAICVITGGISRLFMEFGVVKLFEKLLRPLMYPLFHLPGMASLGAVMTFLSDNPAIISLSRDKWFASNFKKYQFISLTNFGTAFGMGLIVIIYMISMGYFIPALIGLFGAICGCITSTRIVQRLLLKSNPEYANEDAVSEEELEQMEQTTEEEETRSLTMRVLNSLLDGGKTGVDVGLSIIPGVVIISSIVMIISFGPSADGTYTGGAYEGVAFLPAVCEKIDFVFEWLFGFSDPHQIAFPITALGAVGAALSLVPSFEAQGWIDGNAIAVFTAIGMCWSGYLSTHTAMLDSLGYREHTTKAILAHTIGGIVAALVAHWAFMLYEII